MYNNNNYMGYSQFNANNYPQAYPYYNNLMQQKNEQMFRPQTFNAANVNMLQGKIVDSIDVIKAMEIPLDRKCNFLSISRWNSYCNKTITK